MILYDILAHDREARQVIHGLRPTVLDDFGLAAAVCPQVVTLRSEPGLGTTIEAGVELPGTENDHGG
jgi:signal transduction histidine kinase